jgi:hypothetical protein
MDEALDDTKELLGRGKTWAESDFVSLIIT